MRENKVSKREDESWKSREKNICPNGVPYIELTSCSSWTHKNTFGVIADVCFILSMHYHGFPG
jgi:hypothetical protein